MCKVIATCLNPEISYPENPIILKIKVQTKEEWYLTLHNVSLIKHIVGQTFSLFHSTQTRKFVLQGGPWDKILLIGLTSFIIKLALHSKFTISPFLPVFLYPLPRKN